MRDRRGRRRPADREGRVRDGRAVAVVHPRRRVVDADDRDRDGRGVGAAVPVGHRVGERVRALEVVVGVVREAAVGGERQDAVVDVVAQARRERVPVGVRVVAEHARGRLVEEALLGDLVRVVRGDRVRVERRVAAERRRWRGMGRIGGDHGHERQVRAAEGPDLGAGPVAQHHAGRAVAGDRPGGERPARAQERAAERGQRRGRRLRAGRAVPAADHDRDDRVDVAGLVRGGARAPGRRRPGRDDRVEDLERVGLDQEVARTRERGEELARVVELVRPAHRHGERARPVLGAGLRRDSHAERPARARLDVVAGPAAGAEAAHRAGLLGRPAGRGGLAADDAPVAESGRRTSTAPMLAAVPVFVTVKVNRVPALSLRYVACGLTEAVAAYSAPLAPTANSEIAATAPRTPTSASERRRRPFIVGTRSRAVVPPIALPSSRRSLTRPPPP